MAHNDMHVVIYKILSYLYECMKSGVSPDVSKIGASGLCIPDDYWTQIVSQLVGRGYVSGVSVTKTTSGDIVNFPKPSVTLDGVEFLMENSMMGKAKTFLQDVKATVPFI